MSVVAETGGDQRSAFHPDNYQMVSLIMAMRLYDLMFALLDEINPEKANLVHDAHAAGIHFAPPPSFREVEEDELDRTPEGEGREKLADSS